MKYFLILIVLAVVTMNANASMRFLDASSVDLGHQSDFKCSTGATCTISDGKLNFVVAPLSLTMTSGELLTNAVDDVVDIASNDAAIIFSVTSPLATDGDSTIRLIADASADSGDDWQIQHDGATNDLLFQNDKSGTQATFLTLAEVGDMILAGTTPYFTIGDAGAEDAGFVFDGNAQDFNISLDDSVDKLVIGLGSAAGTTNRMAFNSADLNIVVGDASAADAAFIFDGNAQDFSVGMDDSADKLTIALGSVLGTTNRMAFNSADLNIVLGDATAADVGFIYDGNAQDFNISMDDSADKLVIGLGAVAGTTNRMAFNSADLNIVLGDASAADMSMVFDGNAQDFNIGLDDSTDDLVIGLGSLPGTTDAIRIDENQDVTFVQNVLGLGTDALSGFLHRQVASTSVSISASQCGDSFVSNSADIMVLPEASTVLGCRLTFICGTADDFDINPADGTDVIGNISVITGTNTTVVLAPAAGDSIRCTDIGSTIIIEAALADLWVAVGTPNGVWTDAN